MNPYSGFYFITDRGLSKKSVLGDVKAAISGGATIIQYREKKKDSGAMLKEAREIKEICEGKAILLINDRVDIALATDADGVHLGQSDMPLKLARKLLGEDAVIGVTIHNIKEAKEAENEGADYLGVSPIFHTDTKSDAGPAAGLKLLRSVREASKLPLVAIGGIKLENLSAVIEAGADTVCAISATIASDDVRGSVNSFCMNMKRALK